ncbi:MAG: nucleotide sugar dehydrogenase [Candidatus Peribacteraceae bacterium]|nr:nucleotide sugar dehydrogenase [Candidatus Peribacteraceae bacterium]
MTSKILNRIKDKDLKIVVVGLGYVGLPLALKLVKAGFVVDGWELDDSKIHSLIKGKSYIDHIKDEEIQEAMDTKRFLYSGIRGADCYIICVPTPLTSHMEPNLNYVKEAFSNVLGQLKKGSIICLESTTYPGTTEELLRYSYIPDEYEIGKNMYVIYSPEREDPNSKYYNDYSDVPKVVGGHTDNCRDVGCALYNSIFKHTVPVSSTKVAEASKVMENVYRSVNIALVNELKVLFDRMDIDIWEVIEAAKTKPYGYQAFYPGPGLGGHCVPIDPFYLTWKAKEFDFRTRFIELAGEINTDMPYFVADKVIKALNTKNTPINNSKILVLGVAYKPNINDDRESPAHKIITLLEKEGAEVYYNDPYISKITREWSYENNEFDYMESVSLDNLGDYDCVIIITNHDCYNYEDIVDKSNLVVDTRNATNDIDSDKIVKA